MPKDMKQGRMIYLMSVQVEFKKGRTWLPKTATIVSCFDTVLELTNSRFHHSELKAQCVSRSLAGFKAVDNFRIVKILNKKPLSRSFYYYEKS